MASAVMRFKNMTVVRQPQELFRLRVLKGPDQGTVFVVNARQVSVGRGEENQIVLTDLKTSRKHFAIEVNDMQQAQLRDLGSTHGVAVNGKKQAQVYLNSTDKIGVGETVFEFISAEVGATRIMTAPPKMAGAELTKFLIKEPAAIPTAGNASAANASASFLERNKKVLMILTVLMMVATLLPEVEKKQKRKNKYIDPQMIEAERGLSSLTPPVVDTQTQRVAENYFKEGFRELRAKNYLRAITQFETALQVNADHHLARTYLETTRKAMADEAKDTMKMAKRDEEANRSRDALLKYQAVKRLYGKDQSNPLYKEAETRTLELESKLK